MVARDRDELATLPLHLLVLDEAHAIKNSDAQAARGRAPARRAPPRLPVGHADREPPRRAVVAVRLPESRACSARKDEFTLAVPRADRGARRQGPARGAARSRAAVHPAPHEGRGRAGAAGEDACSSARSSSPGAQRELYESIRVAAHADVRQHIKQRGLAGSTIAILDALLKLRQVCCDPRLVVGRRRARASTGSAKLDVLLELVTPAARRRPPHPRSSRSSRACSA